MTQATNSEAAVLEAIRQVIDGASAGRVFGNPIVQDGLIVLPTAKISGGGGGGGGRGQAEHGEENRGMGGGVGLSAKALGVFLIKDGKVAWRPAVDANKVILGGQIMCTVALLALRALVRARGCRLGRG